MIIDDLDTPAVLIDQEIAWKNIESYQRYCDKHGLTLRPHIKTHKLPEFARKQIETGAIGITCQKISEAEVMAEHGIRDILITYNILGETKLNRLLALSEKLEHLSVVADNPTVIHGLSDAFSSQKRPLDVLVECDTGGGRCGVQSPQEAVELATLLESLPGTAFKGLMTYPGAGGTLQVQQFMTNTLQLLNHKNIDCPVISSGGSPDMWQAHEASVVTEYRIGTYIYNDRSLIERGTCTQINCALTILATVISKPTPDRVVIDAGSKVITSDLIGLQHYGLIQEYPELILKSLSEEHGVITSRQGEKINLETGDRISIIPNHCCVVSNMVDHVLLHSNGKNARKVRVAARGCVQ